MKNFIKKYLKKILIVSGLVGVVSAAVILNPTTPAEQPVGAVEESLFAEVDSNNIVLRVIVADQEFIDSGKVGDPNNWIKTSSKGTIRKNYAGKGYIYDKTLDAFIPPKPSDTAILNTTKARWEEPIKIWNPPLIPTSTIF